MTLIHRHSLAATLDAVNAAFFYGDRLSESLRRETAEWIASRQGQPGAYAEMFAPTTRDFQEGIQLFTGERIRSRAATAHILGEEACRALLLLHSNPVDVRRALERATTGMTQRLGLEKQWHWGNRFGLYCCFTCTCALWRHLAAGGLRLQKEGLEAGLSVLRSMRTGLGRWTGFPFFYTLLALSEMNLPTAIAELRYAAPACERILKRSPATGRFHQRRRFLAERVLTKITQCVDC